MCGERGKGRSGKVYHYHKRVSMKKKRTDCKKRAIKKEFIEEFVVRHTMMMLTDDKAIEAIIAMLIDLQERENVNLPLYEQQLWDVEQNIENLLDAIQQGFFTKSTKGHLDELEAEKDELEMHILQNVLMTKVQQLMQQHFIVQRLSRRYCQYRAKCSADEGSWQLHHSDYSTGAQTILRAHRISRDCTDGCSPKDGVEERRIFQ